MPELTIYSATWRCFPHTALIFGKGKITACAGVPLLKTNSGNLANRSDMNVDGGKDACISRATATNPGLNTHTRGYSSALSTATQKSW
nr:hypothetical protein [uncultured Martelella sp.]